MFPLELQRYKGWSRHVLVSGAIALGHSICELVSYLCFALIALDPYHLFLTTRRGNGANGALL